MDAGVEFDKIESAAETALLAGFWIDSRGCKNHSMHMSNKETYSREIYKVLEKAGLSEVTE